MNTPDKIVSDSLSTHLMHRVNPPPIRRASEGEQEGTDQSVMNRLDLVVHNSNAARRQSVDVVINPCLAYPRAKFRPVYF